MRMMKGLLLFSAASLAASAASA
ncbi:MAG: hypothetical protein JWQ17_5983, partial [Tardiphaga sp.]|nr:hypothetical protein [Tardiphaga sp.]